jgi:hypothetical protein
MLAFVANVDEAFPAPSRMPIVMPDLVTFACLPACPKLYHPAVCPQEAYSYVDASGNFSMTTSYIRSYVGDDGAIHIVADRASVKDQVRGCGRLACVVPLVMQGSEEHVGAGFWKRHITFV